MEKANIFIVFSPVSLLLNCTLLKNEFVAVCDLTAFVILTANLIGKISLRISEVQSNKVRHRPALAFWSCAHVPEIFPALCDKHLNPAVPVAHTQFIFTLIGFERLNMNAESLELTMQKTKG